MQLIEKIKVSAGFSMMGDSYCDRKRTPQAEIEKWESKINQWGTKKGCSGTALYTHMEKNKPEWFDADAFVAKKPGKQWNMKDITSTEFPIQAHHLIPKNFLPEHAVCAFLAKGYSKHEKYQLTADTSYNTDNTNNGYCLPYASPLAEWKIAPNDQDKLKICFDVMQVTKRQLHQGSHREGPFDEAPDDEEANIHICGYLTAVGELLDAVQICVQEHLEWCEICKGEKKNNKIEIQPLAAVVRHMDQVSAITKSMIDSNHTFISEPAYLYGNNKLSNIDDQVIDILA